MAGISTVAKERAVTVVQHRRSHPYTALLISELGLILIYPFLSGLGIRDELFRLLAVIVFSTALYSVMGRGWVTTVAMILGAPAIVLRLGNVVEHRQLFQVPDEMLGLVFLIFVSSVLVWSVVSNPSVTADTLAGAMSAYFLIGITFGVAYMTIDSLLPGSFRDTVQPGKPFTPMDFTFFSFVTLTTVGYGDIVPWAAHARSLAIVESMIGIMYPAVLISRLVGLHGRKRENE